MNKLKIKSIAQAGELLALGRQPDFVKRITGVTIIEMVRQGFLVEVMGRYRSVFRQPKKATGKSNKQMKREDRKAFFQRRRAAV